MLQTHTIITFSEKEKEMRSKVKISDILKSSFILILAVLTVIFPKETADSAVGSINICINSIIPSMFAFMVITTYIQSSCLYRVIFRPILPALSRIVRADDNILSIFLLSLIGGYPVGIKLLKEDIAQNTNSPAIARGHSIASLFCYCISPSFAIIMIGNGVFGSTEAGVIVYISSTLANITAAAVISHIYDLKSSSNREKTFTGNLTGAVNSASKALFGICTVIVAFNIALTCVSELLKCAGIIVPPIVAGFFEISNLLNIESPSVSLIPFVSAIASSGGICVMLQCAAIGGDILKINEFIAARVSCALLSGLYTMIILKFTDISVSVSTFARNYSYEFSANTIIVPVLTAMCIIIFYKSDKILKNV